MELITGIKTRRTVRKFTDKPVSKEAINEIISAAAYAPSWKNTQTTRWNIVTDKALIEKIADEAVYGFAHNHDIIRNCGCIAVQSIVKGRCGYERDGSFTTPLGDSWEMYDAVIAAQTFCLAAHDMGIGCVIMGIVDGEKLSEILSLPDTERVAAVIAMGYPAEEPNCPHKKSAEEISRYF